MTGGRGPARNAGLALLLCALQFFFEIRNFLHDVTRDLSGKFFRSVTKAFFGVCKAAFGNFWRASAEQQTSNERRLKRTDRDILPYNDGRG